MKSILLLLFISFVSAAQSPIKITYQSSFNGQISERAPKTIAFADQEKTLITSDRILDKKANLPAEQIIFYPKKRQLQYVSELKESNYISGNDTLKFTYEKLPETKQILGYTCKKAKTIVNSNTIEIWYTNEIPYKIGPSNLGIDLGAVLETVRNGNTIVTAEKIDKNVVFPSIPKTKNSDLLTYRDLIWKSRFITLPVFDKELINWNENTKAKEGVSRYANGTLIVKKVKFPEITKNQQVFIELKQRSNGDAYDRTGSVFVIPEGKEINFFDGLKNGIKTLPTLKDSKGEEFQGMTFTENYLPNLELMRFFTSFGISHFNYNQIKGKEWLESTSFRQEISELKTSLSNKELYVGTYIGNYDGGGHEVSLEITIHNGGSSYHNFDYVLPLANTVNVMEMGGQNYSTIFHESEGLKVEFELEKDLKDAKIRYITTGHGGWGNGDEFLPKSNKIFLDRQLVHSFTPWRQDCGSYRLSNPVSGNFASGLSSSDLSRSNWCPATVTNPVYIDLGDLKAGKHSLQIKIPQGEREGSSFSFWNISAVLLGAQH